MAAPSPNRRRSLFYAYCDVRVSILILRKPQSVFHG